jgi:hypothetical protein
MRKQKKFDCVEMKREIQQLLLEEFRGIDEEKAHKLQMGQILSNPILGPFMTKLEPKSKTMRKPTQ